MAPWATARRGWWRTALRAQGNASEARELYAKASAVRERLAKSDPNNVGWQYDLTYSYIRGGELLREQGNVAEALVAQRAALAIRERSARNDPSNAGWQ